MPVNPINSLSGVNKFNSVSFKAGDAEKKEQKTDANLAEKLHHSKLPYVAGGVVLAGLGVFLGNRYLKGVKKEPHVQKEILAIEAKVKDKVDEVVDTVITEIKDAVKKEEKTVVAEIKDAVKKEEKTVVAEIKDAVKKEEKAVVAEIKDAVKKEEDAVGEVIISKVKPKEPKTAKQAKEINELKQSAVDAQIVPDAKEKNNGISNIIQSLKSNALKKEEAIKPVKELNDTFMTEAIKIVSDNNHGGYVELKLVEKAARDFAADKNRPHNIAQAANLLEYGYTRAYLRSYGNRSAEGLENIINRVSNESNDLFAIYAKMPKEEVLNRLTVWSDSMRLQDAGFNFKAMDSEGFRKEMIKIMTDKKII